MEVVHKSQYFLVEKIIATVSLIVWFLINMNQTFILLYAFRLFSTEMFQCVAGVVEGVFPGWQWRPVNPGTRSERGEEWQPHNTTLPPCSEYTTFSCKMPGILLILLSPFKEFD